MYGASMDTLYIKKKLFMISMMLIIVGALNWLLIGVLDFNVVNALFGKSIVARAIYVIIGLSALAILCDRDTYLPFLGETVLPCAGLPNRIPPGASKELHVTAPPVWCEHCFVTAKLILKNPKYPPLYKNTAPP